MFRSLFCIILAFAWATAQGADPMATSFTFEQCEGSLAPYPSDIKPVAAPDTLTPVMINHVGRHGARYPASDRYCKALAQALLKAKAQASITPLGARLQALVGEVQKASEGQWGALDSLGMAEMRAIASRMYMNYPALFENSSVKAVSTYAPRCMMSMYSFTHQLDRLNNRAEFSASSGRKFSPLLRPFDTDADYLELRKGPALKEPYEAYIRDNCPTSALDRVLGKGYEYASDDERVSLALAQYYVVAGLQAMGLPSQSQTFFTLEEMNGLWRCFNLRQYLQRTATTLSSIPADIASALLQDLIATTDDFLQGRSSAPVLLRFGHAETLMPLLSLMKMPGCYYLTNYFDTVALHWQDFNIVPMGANLQMVVFKTDDGRPYVRFDLNETPTPLLPGSDDVYIPWAKAKQFLLKCIPFHRNEL